MGNCQISFGTPVSRSMCNMCEDDDIYTENISLGLFYEVVSYFLYLVL